MTSLTSLSDGVHWFLNDVGSRVVAKTGIPSDRQHFGKLILQGLKDAPDFVLQIDGATGEHETFKSVLERSVKCATAMKKMGVKQGETIVLMALNHLDLCIPFHAGLFLGNPIAPLDPTLGPLEVAGKIDPVRPKMIFCQNKLVPIVKNALEKINHQAIVISFGESDCCSFDDFLKNDGEIDEVDTFMCSDYDPAEAYALLVSTSGTTGLPKCAALSHKNLILGLSGLWQGFRTFPMPTRMTTIVSPIHWLSASAHFLLAPILRYTRLQTSAAFTPEHFGGLINKYKPTLMYTSPNFLISLIKPTEGEPVDITCFDMFIIGGSAVPQDLLQEVQALSPRTRLLGLYGMTEIGGLAFYDDKPVPGSMGRFMGMYEYRLIDIDTKQDITEPRKKGELWLKGPSICKGYYNNPEATGEAFEDGWLKTGDIFYRDENYFFFFVERLKLLLKYRNYQVSPVELESVIRQHPSVLDVAVTGIPDREHGDLIVACVARRLNHVVTAKEIKDLVKDSLADSKHLRGGVIFMESLPMTSTTKIDRQLLKKIVLTLPRE